MSDNISNSGDTDSETVVKFWFISVIVIIVIGIFVALTVWFMNPGGSAEKDADQDIRGGRVSIVDVDYGDTTVPCAITRTKGGDTSGVDCDWDAAYHIGTPTSLTR